MKKTMEERLFNVFALVIETIFAFICVVPIILTVSGSFTDERVLFQGLSLIPKKFSTAAYELILKSPAEMLNAYKVTIIITLIGTFLCLLITSMTAYVLYRKDFKYRNQFAFYFFFTTLFSGGLVPGYILMCSLGLRDTYAALIFGGGLFAVTNMIIMRTYFTSNVPMAIIESAKIDGANDFRIYISGVLPLSAPILATVGLLTALGYWNSWQPAMMYISDKNMIPLQYYLYKIFQSAALEQKMLDAGMGSGGNTPTESYKLAMTVFTMGPVVLFYPFVQKYFVSGMTIGAVKE